MKSLTVYSIPNCPNCKKLCMYLDKRMHAYQHKDFTQLDNDDLAQLSLDGYYGIMKDRQFPCVILDGELLPPMTVQEYIKKIEED